MKRLVTALAAAALAVGSALAETQKLAYPTADAASFVIDVPTKWELEPAEEEGEYFHLQSASGAVFSFRTIEGDKSVLDEAIEACVEDMSKRFKDLELAEPQDWTPNGLTGFYATGTAKDDEGNPLRLALGWCALNDGKIAELWFVADADDEDGIAAAEDIANSLSSPE